MFALEITFQDGVSQPEVIFVRRPQGLIGASDYAHVVVEDMKALNFQLRLVRYLGRKFRCKPIGGQEGFQIPAVLEGSYEGEASIDLGDLKFHVTALDLDLLLKESEPPDRAGVRALRQACSSLGPYFPAVVVRGSIPMVVSFVPEQPIYIGRSKYCALRLDSADISAKHARLGYESGEFWIEDLGSTNGTFVNGQQISGRASVPAGAPVVLGREVTVIGVTSEDQIVRATRTPAEAVKKASVPERKYPILVSVSEVARPARLVIPIGSTITIGRDPSCDVWLGAPHVSRKHCSVTLSKTGALTITDTSTNGTAYDGGLLKRGDTLEINGEPRVLDFGGGVTIALCFSESQEKEFTSSVGSLWTFNRKPSADGAVPAVVDQARARRMSSSWRAAAAEKEREKGLAGVLARLVQFYRGLSFPIKIFTIVIFVALMVVLGVLVTLLVPVLT